MLNINDLINSDSFFLIAGPCVVEEKKITFKIAERLKGMCNKLNIPLIFKASYKKANRTKLNSFTGIGDNEALEILNQIKQKLNISITTDVHSVNEIKKVANIVDIIQIPAFLCRQTDLITECAKENKIINIKKGQFLSGESMKFAVEKITHHGNKNVIITERGNMF